MVVRYTFQAPDSPEVVEAVAPPVRFSVGRGRSVDPTAAFLLYSTQVDVPGASVGVTYIREHTAVLAYLAASHPLPGVRAAARKELERTRDEINRLLEGLPDARR